LAVVARDLQAHLETLLEHHRIAADQHQTSLGEVADEAQRLVGVAIEHVQVVRQLMPLDTALIRHIHGSSLPLRMPLPLLPIRSVTSLANTTGQLLPGFLNLAFTVVDPLTRCIGTKITPAALQHGQVLAQPAPFPFTLCALLANLRGIGLLLLAPCVEEFLATLLALASRLIALDDLWTH